MNPSANAIELQSAGTWAYGRPRPPNLDCERACMAGPVRSPVALNWSGTSLRRILRL